jgi:hypothetical protein
VNRNIAVLALALCLTARVALAQNLHYGMNTHVLTAQMADKMVELGAGVARVDFNWDHIEGSCKGCFDWTATDAIRDQARRTHLMLFPTLAYTPRWANGGQPSNYPPLNYQDWYDFVFAIASRYKDDIFYWGIWNEPNLDEFLKDADLRAYRSLVINARAAILAANPRANMLGPEVNWAATANGWFEALMNDSGDLFDMVTVHWYKDGPNPIDVFMDQFVRPYSRNKPLWLTEIGMKPCYSLFGEAGQALFYQRVLTQFEQHRDWWTNITFYDLYDTPTPTDCGAAIVRPDYSNTLAFQVLQAFIRIFP